MEDQIKKLLKYEEEVNEQSFEFSVSLLAFLAEVGAATDSQLVSAHPLNFDLSMELVLRKRVIVAIGENLDNSIFGVTLSTGRQLIDFEVVAHDRQEKIWILKQI